VDTPPTLSAYTPLAAEGLDSSTSAQLLALELAAVQGAAQKARAL
jgi:hypothetical protein